MDPALQRWPHQGRGEGKDHVPPPVGSACPRAAQDTICHLCHKDTLLGHVRIGAHQEPPGPVEWFGVLWVCWIVGCLFVFNFYLFIIIIK